LCLPLLSSPRDPSCRNHVLTPAGEEFREDLRKADAHLARTRAARTAAREANAKVVSKDNPLTAHCDEDWANDPADRLSIAGYVWSFAGRADRH
jgi:NAD(P)H-hydrate repair Nnr-like enzyme with NAD(P)H-hydrate dehydratase domain